MRVAKQKTLGASGALRVCAAIAALLCVWSQLAGLAHMVLVAHAPCPEHQGEQVHVGEGSSHEHASSSGSNLPAVDASHDGDADSHEDCQLALHRREQPIHAPDTAAALLLTIPAAAPAPVMAPVPVAETPRSSLDLFALAPKTSPPAG